MGSPLPEDIELSLKEPLIKLLRVRHLRSVASAVRRLQDDEGLEDGGLPREGGRAEERGVGGRLSPPEDPETQ